MRDDVLRCGLAIRQQQYVAVSVVSSKSQDLYFRYSINNKLASISADGWAAQGITSFF